MRFRRPLLVLLGIAVVATVAGSAWWVRREARASMVRQVQVAEQLAGSERAGRLEEALRSTQASLAAVVDGSSPDELVHDVALLPAVDGVTVRDASGAVVATTGRRSPAVAGFEPADDRQEAWATVVVPVPAPGSGSIAVEVGITSLVPRLLSPLGELVGTTSLVRHDGRVVLTSSSRSSARVQSPEVLRLLARRSAGAATYWSPLLGSHRIGVVTPIGGTDLFVLVGADRAAAHQPAEDLARSIALALAVTVVVVAAVAVAVLALLRVGRRALVRAGEEARRLAQTDQLTGVGNRRAFDAALASLAASGDEPVGVVLLDLDHLKEINDRLGHAAGDEALSAVASVLAESVRSSDVVARIGGDEFAILLPGAPESGAHHVAVTVAARVAVSSTPLAGTISVSAGSASGPAGDLAAVVGEADGRLYEAKRARPSSGELVSA